MGQETLDITLNLTRYILNYLRFVIVLPPRTYRLEISCPGFLERIVLMTLAVVEGNDCTVSHNRFLAFWWNTWSIRTKRACKGLMYSEPTAGIYHRWGCQRQLWMAD